MTESNEETQKIKNNARSISLTVTDSKYNKLLIKIRHENLNWKRFFNMVIDGYLEDDPGIMEYLDKKMSSIRAKKRTNILKKERVLTKEVKDMFGLEQDDIENIYDILEEEFDP